MLRGQPYYVVGTKILTQVCIGYNRARDVGIYRQINITQVDIARAIGEGDIKLHASFADVKALTAPIYGKRGEYYARPEYHTPIYEVFLTAPSACRIEGTEYFTDKTSIIIHKVWFKEKEEVNNKEKTSNVPKPFSFYPQTYDAFFTAKPVEDKTVAEQLVANVKMLFHDYAFPRYGLFLTLHWNRHHDKLAKRIFRLMPVDVAGSYNYLLSKRQELQNSLKRVNMEGSFMRRLDFAIAQLADYLASEEPTIKLDNIK